MDPGAGIEHGADTVLAMSEIDFNEFNRGIIEEFRANGGKVGGPFEGAPMILVTHTGAKSGIRRTTPLVHLEHGDDHVIIASKGGAPESPAWFHNLVANPEVEVEVGTDRFTATARVAGEPERTELYALMAERMPNFAEYQAKTDRVIPVVVLSRNG